MESINVDIYLTDPNGKVQLKHHTITENDLLEYMKEKWENEEISVSINQNREDYTVEFRFV